MHFEDWIKFEIKVPPSFWTEVNTKTSDLIHEIEQFFSALDHNVDNKIIVINDSSKIIQKLLT